jgi:hypothetical protein
MKEKEMEYQTPDSIVFGGVAFEFVKSQRDGNSAVYKGPESYLCIGTPEKIKSDLALHKRMESAGFPVARLIAEGDLDGKAYFIESSVGEKTLSQMFAEETEAAGSISEGSFNLHALNCAVRLVKGTLKVFLTASI